MPDNNFTRNKPVFDPADEAKKYIPAIAGMLDIDKASTQTIKTGVSTVSDLISNYANQRDAVKAHQVRNIFTLIKDTVKSSTGEKDRELNIIRPKLAYIGARQTSNHGKVITEVIDKLIIKITEEPDNEKKSRMLKGLVYIMESIVAYHKFYVKE